ncbi:phosphoglucosamine mutase family protein [Trifolium repens]|nr:phosphoglucosamine mutase family protein [Trifolium repens]
MLVVVLEFKVYVYNFKDFKVIRQVDTFRNPKGLCVVSQLADSMVLVCHGLQKVNLRLPNRIPNREDKTTMKAITKVVFDNKVDLGIVFDTDVEGSAAVDSTGCEFNRNRLIGLMAVIVLEEVRL